mmetsp:Transcript_36796/g.50682  ORF Transcript_36796/g.50682 Transcript_36796/m.50682 type:complete len:85 (+) Transcript_36796:401-655(+)
MKKMTLVDEQLGSSDGQQQQQPTFTYAAEDIKLKESMETSLTPSPNSRTKRPLSHYFGGGTFMFNTKRKGTGEDEEEEEECFYY